MNHAQKLISPHWLIWKKCQRMQYSDYTYKNGKKCKQQNSQNRYIYTFAIPHTFVFSCLLRGFWVTIGILLVIKALKEKALALKEAFVVKLYGSCLSIACLHHLYIVYQLSGRIEYYYTSQYIYNNHATLASFPGPAQLRHLQYRKASLVMHHCIIKSL